MTVRVIPYIRASEMISQARDKVKHYQGYRLGQALYNLLPPKLSEDAMALVDHAKWYNTLDEAYAVRYFYDHFVKEN